MFKLTLLLFNALLIGCGTSDKTVISGSEVFAKNCQVCHGKEAAGLADDWRKPLADGSYPPPPLNGTAHAWHHSPQLLLQIINEGGANIGGKMPAFKDKLSEVEKQAVLEYIYNLWPQDIQEKYDKRFK